jgi:hypothetical protein
MRKTRIAIVGWWVLAVSALSGGIGFAASGEQAGAHQPHAVAQCKLAIVSPVSGFAECVDPPGAPVDPPPPRPTVVKLAVFNFELDDASPAAALLGQTTSTEAAMAKVSDEARQMLEKSGRYLLVDVSEAAAPPVKENSLRNCEGCEAGIALAAGADQALVGIVRRITQTDYYVVIQITDARTGKLVNQQSANFAGGPDGWASGVRMLLKHQVLVVEDQS